MRPSVRRTAVGSRAVSRIGDGRRIAGEFRWHTPSVVASCWGVVLGPVPSPAPDAPVSCRRRAQRYERRSWIGTSGAPSICSRVRTSPFDECGRLHAGKPCARNHLVMYCGRIRLNFIVGPAPARGPWAARRCQRLWSISAADEGTAASAISATTSALRMRGPAGTCGPTLSCNDSFDSRARRPARGSRRRSRRSQSTPSRRSQHAAVYRGLGQRGTAYGTSLNMTAEGRRAPPTDRLAPPTTARVRLSTMNCRSTRPRPAPIATRIAIFAAPRRGAGQQQVRDVRAGDAQHQQHGAEQNQERCPRVFPPTCRCRG
jgi:hypothetical protein